MALRQWDPSLLGPGNVELAKELYNTAENGVADILLGEKISDDVYSFTLAKNKADVLDHFQKNKRVMVYTGEAGRNSKVVTLHEGVLNLHYIGIKNIFEGEKVMNLDYIIGKKNVGHVLRDIYLPEFMKNK